MSDDLRELIDKAHNIAENAENLQGQTVDEAVRAALGLVAEMARNVATLAALLRREQRR